MKLPPGLAAKCLELAGVPGGSPAPAGRKRNPPRVVTAPPDRFAVTLALPCRVVSEANTRSHWAARRRRFREQGGVLLHCLAALGWYAPTGGYVWPFGLPAAVTLAHVGPAMDDDNLRGAFKGLRDLVAEWAGVDDADPRVAWGYEQRRGRPGVEVRVRAAAGETLGPGA